MARNGVETHEAEMPRSATDAIEERSSQHSTHPNIKAHDASSSVLETAAAVTAKPEAVGLGIGTPELKPVDGELAEIAENATQGIYMERAAQKAKASQSEESVEKEKILKKLSPTKIHELTSSPESLSLHAFPDIETSVEGQGQNGLYDGIGKSRTNGRIRAGSAVLPPGKHLVEMSSTNRFAPLDNVRPELSPRTLSTPPPTKRTHSSTTSRVSGFSRPDSSIAKSRRGIAPPPLPLDAPSPGVPKVIPNGKNLPMADPAPSPMPPSIPLPPLSMPTYLQLELSSSRPSPLYIHRSVTSDFPYESSRIKFERLQNFLLLPPNLEGVLWFGALACLDAWLYSFTILPLRFIKAVAVLSRWWGENAWKEAQDLCLFIYLGLIRMWNRRHEGSISAKSSAVNTPSATSARSRRGSYSWDGLPDQKHSGTVNARDSSTSQSYSEHDRKRKRNFVRRHRRTKSTPSALLPSHKADILKGLVVFFSCIILTRFDASRMYHGIRGQAAIKLYVIYNVLEVCDRLFSALGQDVFECLFSRETLERNSDGRSKLLRPFGMFLLALAYNVIHSTALFYQVITLNVAVNSYSNALLTLLMSNQFVEIKSTVFKKFEKENLFQLTCADVVERFQLWLMLMIIALRNLVEVGLPSLSFSIPSALNPASKSFRSGILPKSFTLFPEWSGQLFGPFFLVLGSEMLVDWLKHAYITKFNNTKPAIYGRFLDVLSKDYYSNAFADQNLTKRLGLPVIPLSCLFIRASLQTYHMFLATHMPLPMPSTATSLAEPTTSPETTAALQHVDAVIRRALGRSSFGGGSGDASSVGFPQSLLTWTADDVIALTTLLVVLLLFFLVLLAVKLVLGMCLLSFARRRYKDMKEREGLNIHTGGRRVGGWGVVEVDEDKRRWIYADDPEGMKAARERERMIRERGKDGSGSGKDSGFGGVSRYTMVAKRIW